MVQSLLNSQVGMEVNINRGGPYSSRGRLLAIKEDHLVVKTDEHGPVYYQIENIESAGVDSREDRYALPSNVMEGDWCEDEVCLEDVYYNMRYYVVDINRGGAGAVRGILIHFLDDFLLLVDNDKIVNVCTKHIVSISRSREVKAIPERISCSIEKKSRVSAIPEQPAEPEPIPVPESNPAPKLSLLQSQQVQSPDSPLDISSPVHQEVEPSVHDHVKERISREPALSAIPIAAAPVSLSGIMTEDYDLPEMQYSRERRKRTRRSRQKAYPNKWNSRTKPRSKSEHTDVHSLMFQFSSNRHVQRRIVNSTALRQQTNKRNVAQSTVQSRQAHVLIINPRIYAPRKRR